MLFPEFFQICFEFLDSLLQLLDGQALCICSFITHTLDAPCTVFLNQGIARPEPMSLCFFVDCSRLGKLWQRIAKRCFLHFHGPASLELLAVRRTTYTKWKPEP